MYLFLLIALYDLNQMKKNNLDTYRSLCSVFLCMRKSIFKKNICFIFLFLLSNLIHSQNTNYSQIDTFAKVNNTQSRFSKDFFYCGSCLLKLPVELSKSQLYQSQFLLQIKDKQTITYDSTADPFEITRLSYDSLKRNGYLEIQYIQGADTTYQKGKFYLSDTIFNGYYIEENVRYKYCKLLKDSVWNIGHRGEYYTYKMNVLHGKYQTYATKDGETGNYNNGYQAGLCQWYDSDDQKYIEDFYDMSGNCLYSKQYKIYPEKYLFQETYLVINDKANSDSGHFYDFKNFKWCFKKYDSEGHVVYEGFKRWDNKKDDIVFYGVHKYYIKNKLVKIVQYDNNGKTLFTKTIN
jgi:hypothetical protein